MMLFKHSITIFNYSEKLKGYIKIPVDRVYFKDKLSIVNTLRNSDEKKYIMCVISEKYSKIIGDTVFIPDDIPNDDTIVLPKVKYKKITDIELYPNKSYIYYGFTDETDITNLLNNYELYKILEYVYQGISLSKGIYIKTEFH